MKVAILSGSVYGTAEEVARHAVKLLNAAGFEAWHNPRATLAELQAFAPQAFLAVTSTCLLYTSPSPRDLSTSRMPSSA